MRKDYDLIEKHARMIAKTRTDTEERQRESEQKGRYRCD